MTAAPKKVVLLFPRFEEGFLMGKVPLGLAYMAAVLKGRGHYVEGYNLIVDPIEEVDFAGFDYCGITVLTSFISEVRRMCAYIKERNPRIKIVLGGSHPSILPEESMGISEHVDYVIAGEGEFSMAALVEAADPAAAGIPGVYYREGGAVRGRRFELIKDLDVLPYPDQRLFDHGRLEKRNPFRAIMASRGCPFKCYNCQPYLRDVLPFRLRSARAVAGEVLHLNREYGQTYFGFIDSEFPMNKKWFMEYRAALGPKAAEFSFHCNARSDLLDGDILRAYREMNITRLAIGVESGNQRVVDEVLHKGIDLVRTREIFALAAEHRVATHGHFMIGIPGETMAEMNDTVEYALSIPAGSVEFNILTPWPGTRFYELCEKNGWLDSGLRHEDYNEKRISVVSTDQWSSADVMAFYGEIRRRFKAAGWINSDDGSVFFRDKAAQRAGTGHE